MGTILICLITAASGKFQLQKAAYTLGYALSDSEWSIMRPILPGKTHEILRLPEARGDPAVAKRL